MVDFAQWLAQAGTLDPTVNETTAGRAVMAWRHILEKPISVVFLTPAGITLGPQTVRLESDNTATTSERPLQRVVKRKVIIFGVQDHPTEDDTVLGEGYRFVHDNDQYTVVDVIRTQGEVQGVAEVVG